MQEGGGALGAFPDEAPEAFRLPPLALRQVLVGFGLGLGVPALQPGQALVELPLARGSLAQDGSPG
eukprot:38157-Lingulodinium_polyedra.AAC.1